MLNIRKPSFHQENLEFVDLKPQCDSGLLRDSCRDEFVMREMFSPKRLSDSVK
jgi:hypothetical protein